MGCNCKNKGTDNTINGIDKINGSETLNYFSRILTFGVSFILSPFILIGVYYLMFKHIIIKGRMVIDINEIINQYSNWKGRKNNKGEEEDDDVFNEEYENINPEDYELITKVENLS